MTATFAKVIPLRPEGHDIDDLSDEALVAACTTGDRAARAALFSRHVDFVYRFVAKFAGADKHAVEDLVQATFLEAFAAVHTFRGASAVRTWLCGIAHNVVRNYVRAEVRRKHALARMADHHAQGFGSKAALSAAQRTAFTRLEAALPLLPQEQREVFVMCDVLEMKGAEVAQVLRVPEGTVWRRLHEARQQLRAAIAREEGLL